MTLKRCPVCRARLRGENDCRRCGAALGHVIRIAARAAAAERAAIVHLAEGRPAAATRAIEEACRLRRTPLTTALETIVASLPPTSDPRT